MFFASARALSKRFLLIALALLVVGGFGLRCYRLSAEGLSEDELNKLQAAADYRNRGISPSNGEHPMLMKALMTASIIAAEEWNHLQGSNAKLDYSPDAAKQESARRPVNVVPRTEPSLSHNLPNQSSTPQSVEATPVDETKSASPNSATSNTAPHPLAEVYDYRAESPYIIAPETALRFPAALFGALTAIAIFLVARELFGTNVALLAAALWAFDPTAAGLNRIAKEDSFFIFFFLLGSFFILRAQTRANRGKADYNRYLWFAAAAFGAMVAAKYYPHFLGVIGAYYGIFIGIKSNRWQVGKVRWLLFMIILGVVFVLCNLTIILPGTWYEMRTFATEKRIGHDSMEFMGELYPNQMTRWLAGVPVTFYLVFLLVKTTLPMLAGFFAGVVQCVRRRTGDGRFYLLFYFLIGFAPFMVFGGKFTRYYTLALPLVTIIAAIGLRWLGDALARHLNQSRAGFIHSLIAFVAIAFAVTASVNVAPYYRLYNNVPGGGASRAGDYFPHDDFYDASMREAAFLIAREAAPRARIASESPRLFLHYATLAARPDLQAVSLSDADARRTLEAGDFVILARGRRYFSNSRLTAQLPLTQQPAYRLSLDKVPSAKIFKLDETALQLMRE